MQCKIPVLVVASSPALPLSVSSTCPALELQMNGSPKSVWKTSSSLVCDGLDAAKPSKNLACLLELHSIATVYAISGLFSFSCRSVSCCSLPLRYWICCSEIYHKLLSTGQCLKLYYPDLDARSYWYPR